MVMGSVVPSEGAASVLLVETPIGGEEGGGVPHPRVCSMDVGALPLDRACGHVHRANADVYRHRRLLLLFIGHLLPIGVFSPTGVRSSRFGKNEVPSLLVDV